MNTDAILLGLTPKEFRSEVDKAFKACRAVQRGDRRPALASAWASTSLVAEMMVVEPVAAVDGQATALMRLLRWALEAKFGEASATESAELRQRCYASLYFPYFKAESLEMVAGRMGSDVSTLYDSRNQAIEEVTQLLQAELQEPRYQAQRRLFVITQLLQELADPHPAILRLLAVFALPIPLVKLQQLVKDLGIAAYPERPITHLINRGFVRLGLTAEAVQIVELFREQLTLLTEAADVRRYHTAAAQHAVETGEYLLAARHWCNAGKPDRAVEVLVKHYEQVVNAGQIDELYALQSELQQTELTPDLWAQLKLMLGRAALMVDDPAASVREFTAAFSTKKVTDLYITIRACYFLAKTYEKANFWSALAQFDRGIELLKALPDQADRRTDDLLADFYIGEAWLYIQMQPDLEQAATCLYNAQALIQPEDASRLTAFHAAQAALEFANKQQLEAEIMDRYKALVAAEQSGDQDAICKACFNLAQGYREAKDFPAARPYLDRAYTLAKKLKDTEKQGRCLQEYGAVAFGEADYSASIAHHQQAYTIYKHKKLKFFTCAVCYDLAEAHAKLGQWEQAKRYYQEALTLAQPGIPMLQHDLGVLATNYPKLLEKLNERQKLAMEYINQHGEIANSRYQEITGAAKKTAERDLKELVGMGFLQQIGKGPSTRYIRANRPTTPKA